MHDIILSKHTQRSFVRNHRIATNPDNPAGLAGPMYPTDPDNPAGPAGAMCQLGEFGGSNVCGRSGGSNVSGRSASLASDLSISSAVRVIE